MRSFSLDQGQQDQLFLEGITAKTVFFAGLKAQVWHAGGGIMRVAFSTRGGKPKLLEEAYRRARGAFKGYDVRPSWRKKEAAHA